MKRRILVTLVAHRIIETDTENYTKSSEETVSEEEMDQLDIEGTRDDPFLFVDNEDTVVGVHITHLPNEISKEEKDATGGQSG